MRMTEEEYKNLMERRAFSASKGPNLSQETQTVKGEGVTKYRSQKVYADEGTFDSKKEYGRYQQLKLLRDAGKIFDLQRQVTFPLLGPEKLLGEKRTKPALRYIADFIYVENGRLVVEDTKSDKTRALPAYRLKKHAMKSLLNLDIVET